MIAADPSNEDGVQSFEAISASKFPNGTTQATHTMETQISNGPKGDRNPPLMERQYESLDEADVSMKSVALTAGSWERYGSKRATTAFFPDSTGVVGPPQHDYCDETSGMYALSETPHGVHKSILSPQIGLIRGNSTMESLGLAPHRHRRQFTFSEEYMSQANWIQSGCGASVVGRKGGRKWPKSPNQGREHAPWLDGTRERRRSIMVPNALRVPCASYKPTLSPQAKSQAWTCKKLSGFCSEALWGRNNRPVPNQQIAPPGNQTNLCPLCSHKLTVPHLYDRGKSCRPGTFGISACAPMNQSACRDTALAELPCNEDNILSRELCNQTNNTHSRDQICAGTTSIWTDMFTCGVGTQCLPKSPLGIVPCNRVDKAEKSSKEMEDKNKENMQLPPFCSNCETYIIFSSCSKEEQEELLANLGELMAVCPEEEGAGSGGLKSLPKGKIHVVGDDVATFHCEDETKLEEPDESAMENQKFPQMATMAYVQTNKNIPLLRETKSAPLTNMKKEPEGVMLHDVTQLSNNSGDVYCDPSPVESQEISWISSSGSSLNRVQNLIDEQTIATKVIGNKLLVGFALTQIQCEICEMPLMENEDGVMECVVCPAIAAELACRKVAMMGCSASQSNERQDLNDPEFDQAGRYGLKKSLSDVIHHRKGNLDCTDQQVPRVKSDLTPRHGRGVADWTRAPKNMKEETKDGLSKKPLNDDFYSRSCEAAPSVADASDFSLFTCIVPSGDRYEPKSLATKKPQLKKTPSSTADTFDFEIAATDRYKTNTLTVLPVCVESRSEDTTASMNMNRRKGDRGSHGPARLNETIAKSPGSGYCLDRSKVTDEKGYRGVAEGSKQEEDSGGRELAQSHTCNSNVGTPTNLWEGNNSTAKHTKDERFLAPGDVSNLENYVCRPQDSTGKGDPPVLDEGKSYESFDYMPFNSEEEIGGELPSLKSRSDCQLQSPSIGENMVSCTRHEDGPGDDKCIKNSEIPFISSSCSLRDFVHDRIGADGQIYQIPGSESGSSENSEQQYASGCKKVPAEPSSSDENLHPGFPIIMVKEELLDNEQMQSLDIKDNQSISDDIILGPVIPFFQNDSVKPAKRLLCGWALTNERCGNCGQIGMSEPGEVTVLCVNSSCHVHSINTEVGDLETCSTPSSSCSFEDDPEVLELQRSLMLSPQDEHAPESEEVSQYLTAEIPQQHDEREVQLQEVVSKDVACRDLPGEKKVSSNRFVADKESMVPTSAFRSQDDARLLLESEILRQNAEREVQHLLVPSMQRVCCDPNPCREEHFHSKGQDPRLSSSQEDNHNCSEPREGSGKHTQQKDATKRKETELSLTAEVLHQHDVRVGLQHPTHWVCPDSPDSLVHDLVSTKDDDSGTEEMDPIMSNFVTNHKDETTSRVDVVCNESVATEENMEYSVSGAGVRSGSVTSVADHVNSWLQTSHNKQIDKVAADMFTNYYDNIDGEINMNKSDEVGNENIPPEVNMEYSDSVATYPVNSCENVNKIKKLRVVLGSSPPKAITVEEKTDKAVKSKPSHGVVTSQGVNNLEAQINAQLNMITCIRQQPSKDNAMTAHEEQCQDKPISNITSSSEDCVLTIMEKIEEAKSRINLTLNDDECGDVEAKIDAQLDIAILIEQLAEAVK